ncbi:MAG: hypothetical protein QF858_03585 [Candidatus Pacebacteria bacterium]|jgi:hypothetical protein|nr:hypothetical protein [bacterium]MDP6527931.1 hypothetical protein [Candidatus Paceibacterota bacterium]MDP6659465.1 hypothetical protein [Candidatus Paceibacterota bacterium]|tara:strand:- start:5557 stop:6003 length:447 start_codon:yes stop_codon:yes gene_type:complete
MKKYRNKGFTLLIAVLVTGLMLSIGIAIYGITSKEIVLSSIGRESQFSFYAADTGVECALYWDQKGGKFSTTTASTLTCANTTVADGGGVGYEVPMTFQFEVARFCSIVSVTKSLTHPRTKVESKGYNTTCEETENPLRVERAIRVTY